MAGKGSGAKRHRQSEKRRLENKSKKSEVRTSVRKFVEAVKAGDKETAEKNLKNFQKLMDTAASKGVFHRNTASRKKSRMFKLLNSMEAQTA